ncbi:unnamed protein product [Clonostachys solani]|uniref:Uncharacterized protein n=1 Tax=Clonostachys solani TaxID=160281 RepID=A0A9N9W5S6_9HYPO|nr:unnamed protein product [Clonostachys solani]
MPVVASASATTITLHPGPTLLTTSSVTPDSQANTSPAPPSLTHVVVLAIALSFTLTGLLATMTYLVWKRRVGKARRDEMIESRSEIPHCRSPRLRKSQARFDKAELDARSCELRSPLSDKDDGRATRSPAELPATPVSKKLEAALSKETRWF